MHKIGNAFKTSRNVYEFECSSKIPSRDVINFLLFLFRKSASATVGEKKLCFHVQRIMLIRRAYTKSDDNQIN